jgi:hypothetical protein
MGGGAVGSLDSIRQQPQGSPVQVSVSVPALTTGCVGQDVRFPSRSTASNLNPMESPGAIRRADS